MHLKALFRLSLGLLLVTSPLGNAAVDSCQRFLQSQRPITLRALREMSAERVEAAERIVPRPGFTDISIEASREQVGESGPLALQQFLSPGQSFVSTPAPTNSDVAAVNLVEEARSVVIHSDVDWEGERTSTAIYVSLPAAKILSAGNYLLGPEYPVALVFLHGGGTPTATGKNGMTLGERLTALNIPVLSIDMPGHGRATRKVDGFSTFKQQVDWLMKVLEQNIHPSVKLILSGHSWGGEFAVYMHRLSKDPHYKRILKYIAVSPPVDVSLGGDVRKKLEHELWYERNFHTLKEQIGPSDFEFRENLLRNGKDSDVGAYHTAFTFMDYLLPVLSVKEWEELKPFSVAVGTADGMVYVGYEETFAALFGHMDPSEYLLLGPGDTWKGKNQPTAHNVWDRYIDGTTTLQMYTWLGEQVLRFNGGKNPDLPIVDKAAEVLDQYFRHYANFFAFRELVANSVEYVRVENQEAHKLGLQKRQLDDYLKKVDAREAALVREQDEKSRAAVEGLRQELGLQSMTLPRAQQELEMKPLTAERKHELQAYIEAVDQIERGMRESFKDAQYESDLSELTKKYKKVIEQTQMTNISDYKQVLDQLQAKKSRVSKEEDWQRGELSRLHQDMLRVLKQRRERYGVERENRLLALKAPDGISDHKMAMRELNADLSPERRLKVQSFVDRYAAVEQAARRQVVTKIADDIASIPKPEGIQDLEHARRQRKELDSILALTFAPGDPTIDPLARRIESLSEELYVVEKGDDKRPSLDRLQNSVWELRIKRNNLVTKKWPNLWLKNLLTSEEYSRKLDLYEKALANYKQIYFSYTQNKSEWLLELKQSGRLLGDVVKAGTPELKLLLRRLVKARSVFFEALDDLEHTKWSEAIEGKLKGPDGLVKEAQKVAMEIWGPDFPTTRQPSAGSLSAVLRIEEEYLEARRREEALLERQLNELRAEYSQKMNTKGIALPFRVEGVNIYANLNRPLKDLLAAMRRDRVLMEAMQKTLARWESMHSELRREVQLKGNVE